MVYDTGALIGAERGDRPVWALHRATLRRGLVPTVPTGVLAEAWRGGPQARMSTLLRGCSIEPLTEGRARSAGVLAARSGLRDIVDLSVADAAVRRGDAVVTSNRSHIQQATAAAGKRVAIHDA